MLKKIIYEFLDCKCNITVLSCIYKSVNFYILILKYTNDYLQLQRVVYKFSHRWQHYILIVWIRYCRYKRNIYSENCFKIFMTLRHYDYGRVIDFKFSPRAGKNRNAFITWHMFKKIIYNKYLDYDSKIHYRLSYR